MENEIHKLKLEVQELRQFCLMLLNSPSSTGQLRPDLRNYWWAKFGNYERVE